jgi:monoamine oxidase
MAPKDVRPSTRFLNGHNLPEPQGYSDAASVNGAKRTIYTSGQLGQHSDGSFTSAFGEQALPATRNLLDVVRAAGASAKDFVKLTFYIVDWNENMHEELFAALSLLAVSDGGTPMQPTTTLIPVPRLAFSEAKLEIEAVVCVGGLAQIWTVEEDSTSQPSDAKEIDVVVIGGGFSGCMAAYDVQQAGHSVMLCEAKHRIGGQSSTQKLRSGPGLVELGATWINKVTQPTVYELTRRFGLDCKDQYLQGDVIWELHDGSFVRASTNLPEVR